MHFKTYYRVVVLLPIGVLLLRLFFGSSGIASILNFPLWPLLAEYAVFAACSFIYMGRLDSVENVRIFIWRLPLLFTAGSLLGLYIYQFWNQGRHISMSAYLDITIPLAVFVVFIGYAYCLIADLVFAALKKCGLISLGSRFSS